MLAPRKTLWRTPPEVVVATMRAIPLRSTGDVIVDVGCGEGAVLIQWARELLAAQAVVRSEDKPYPEYRCPPTNTTMPTANMMIQEVTFIGIDVEERCIEAAKSAWEKVQQQEEHLLLRVQKTDGCCGIKITMKFICANALECRDLWQPYATVLFLYLIPRGLRLLLPPILALFLNQHHPTTTEAIRPVTTSSTTPPLPSPLRTIASFMNPIPSLDSASSSAFFQFTKKGLAVSRQRLRVPVSDETMWPLYIYTMKNDIGDDEFSCSIAT